MTDFIAEMGLAARLAREAGAIALKHRKPGVRSEEKPDGAGPVTAADKECDALIRKALKDAFPNDGLLTEETPDDGEWRQKDRVWMVDPLDGTKEFINGGEEFAAMIGLAVKGVPSVGAVYRPVGDTMFVGARGRGAWRDRSGQRTRLNCPSQLPDPVVVAVSKSHRSQRLDDLLSGLGPIKELARGSVGLKIAMIAEGDASAYLNASRRSCLWDSCGPAAILLEAGGKLSDLAGNPILWTGGLEHQSGLFCATAAVHTHLQPKVLASALRIVAALKELPEYPRDAFVLSG